MKLDPDAAARVASFGPTLPMRERGLTAVRESIESAPHPGNMPPVAHIEDCAAPGPAGPIPLRIYRPTHTANAPVLVYFHGGGMVMGSNHSFEPLARTLAAQSNATVVAVDSDRLYPQRLSTEIVAEVPGARGHLISSPYGHDGFLIEIDQVGEVVRAAMG